MSRQCLGVLWVIKILGKELLWWRGHFREGHDCRVLEVSIRRGKMGRRQERELRVGWNHLLLLLNVHAWHRMGWLLIGWLQWYHVGWVGLHS